MRSAEEWAQGWWATDRDGGAPDYQEEGFLFRIRAIQFDVLRFAADLCQLGKLSVDQIEGKILSKLRELEAAPSVRDSVAKHGIDVERSQDEIDRVSR